MRSLAFVFILLDALAAPAQPVSFDEGGIGLGLALRRLGTTARVLYVTAHPDDENNAVLVRLARGEGVRTALLTLTRGEGGQNAIGPELGSALGVLRTEELAAIHRYDGVEQYFGRAYEFGFSYSVEESFQKWGREETLGDVVRVVRAFRPDVMLTLPLEAPGGGQHHQAAAQLARDAFRAAADPARFPEQIALGLRPWQAHALYRSGVGGGGDPADTDAVLVPIAVFDPLLGMTWTELGGLARRSHRSQDQGAGRGPAILPPARYVLVDSEPPLPAAHGLLDGIDPSLPGLLRFLRGTDEPAAKTLEPRLRELEIGVGKAQAAFDSRAPERTAPWLEVLLRILRALPADVPAEGREEIVDRLADERRDVEQALALALGVRLEARARDDAVVPGQSFRVDVSLRNEGRDPLPVQELALDVPPGWRATVAESTPSSVAPGAEARLAYDVTVAADAPVTRPYWRKAPDRDRLLIDRPQDDTLPWSPPDLVLRAVWGTAGVTSTTPVRWRGGRSPGVEKQKLPNVVPALSVRLAPSVAVVPVGTGQAVRVFKATVTDHTPGGGTASVRLVAPDGWTVTPATRELSFRYEGETIDAAFDVKPPARLGAGSHPLRAVVSREGREYGEGVQVLSYEHIQDRPLVGEAQARLVAVDVKAAPKARIGYVMGSGDGVAEALQQIGFPVTLLDVDALGSDLSRFTTIVTGIRAFEVRDDLRAKAARLLDFARAGGHVVVQYNRAAFNRAGPTPRPADAPAESPFAPYPAAVSSRRVTDETAPVRLLVPDHPFFTRPNRLGPADWEGWVQERAIQALDARDARYRELLTARDPFPQNPGEQKGLLVDTPVGRGTWTYVGLVLFRQVAAGTPGAYRLLANLASRPRQ